MVKIMQKIRVKITIPQRIKIVKDVFVLKVIEK